MSPATPGERRGPDPTKPGTVYRSRPKLFRRRGSDGMAGLTGRPGAGAPDAGQQDPYPQDPYPQDPYAQHPGAQDRYAQAPFAQGSQQQAAAPQSGGTLPPGPDAGFRGGPGGSGGTLAPRPPVLGRGRNRRTRPSWKLLLPLVLVLLLIYPVVLSYQAWSNLTKVAALPEKRPADTPGRTYLVVGSDSRAGLTKAQRKKLATGKIGGQRTDTIMLLHVPDGDGPTVLVSIPRDSYVSIPGHGKNKINAAYAFGGAQLLVRTVQQATGVTIDEYVQTGLGGYADLVDAIGGVNICSPRAFNDKKAGLNIPKGCQDMDGATALGYARARYSDPRGDLGRVERQRQVLAAIASKTLSPGVILAPWRAVPAASAGGGALTVDDGTTPVGLAKFVLAMRAVSGGNGLSLTVPVGNPALRTPAGEAVSWDTAKANTLFTALRTDDTTAIEPLAAEQKPKKK